MDKSLLRFSIIISGLLLTTQLQAQKMITTIAGTGTAGFGGDAAAATAAKLDNPTGVAVDDSGKIYIVDRGNARVRRISKTGVITTIAGTGVAGYNGDNIVATTAKIDARGIAADKAGNVYIADQGNNCVRKISAAGIISPVAGDTSMGFSGDNGAATAAKLFSPSGVAIDRAGNVYIADMGNNRIRKVSSGIITTVAGGGSGGLGDGGPATAATLNTPMGVAVDTAGNIYIVDQGNNRIRQVSTMGLISTIAGTGSAGWTGDGGAAVAATLNYPSGIAVDDSMNVYVAEGNSNVIRMIKGGNIYTICGTNTPAYGGDGGPATAAKLDNPVAVATDTSGKLYVADLANNRVRRIAYVSHTAVASVPTVSELVVSPNPNNGAFYVQATIADASEQISLEVVDLLGRVVYTGSVRVMNGSIISQIEINSMDNGIYLLRLHTGSGTTVHKFVVQR